jgi:hypothetical protein
LCVGRLILVAQTRRTAAAADPGGTLVAAACGAAPSPPARFAAFRAAFM